MLVSISLRNFAIIDSISVDFKRGLNIITGDTGAGKSIIIDALSLIKGSKASPEYIRSGAEEASIEAVFSVKGHSNLETVFNEYAIDLDDTIVIRRVISSSGKSKIIVNGYNVTLSMLTVISHNLIDIFGQNYNRDLLNVSNHLDYLDSYGISLELLDNVHNSYSKLETISAEIKKTEAKISDKRQKQDFLKYQCDEIEKASLDINEEELLKSERKILLNTELLSSNIGDSYYNLYERDDSICEQLQDLSNKLEECIKVDETLTECTMLVQNSITNMKEIAYVLRDYKDNISSNPSRLDEIEDRMARISELKRKYGGDIPDILKTYNGYKRELIELDFIDDKLNELQNEYQKQLEIYCNASAVLSRERKETASKLSSEVERELTSLGIKSARFEVNFSNGEYSKRGTDKVEFYFSSNPDEELKPLAKVISGGELSRIMLVIQTLIRKKDSRSILIFDEPDSGVGGAIAEAVGKKIKDISVNNQVLCVTHLAQVAKFADNHITVKKEHVNNSTVVIASTLDDDQRVDELARMMGGLKITKKTVEAARDMIKH